MRSPPAAGGAVPAPARPLPEKADALLARFSDDVIEVVLRLRERVLALVPRAHERVADVGYTVALTYGPDARTSGAVVYVTGFSRHANLGFPDGASLGDGAGVLEGDGARMRHVKFRAPEDVDAAAWLDGYLDAALALAGLGRDMGDGRTTVRTRVSPPGPPGRGGGRRSPG
jgi:hypothetical protein